MCVLPCFTWMKIETLSLDPRITVRKPGAALVEIVILLVTITETAMRCAQFSSPAFSLMARYAAWVLYASSLNFGICRLNKGLV